MGAQNAYRIWLPREQQYDSNCRYMLLPCGEIYRTSTMSHVVVESSEAVVEMSTGYAIKDQPLYEHDLLKVYRMTNYDSSEYVRPVIWCHGCLCISVKTVGDTPLYAIMHGMDGYPVYDLEIIGNINQNPELLRGVC